MSRALDRLVTFFATLTALAGLALAAGCVGNAAPPDGGGHAVHTGQAATGRVSVFFRLREAGGVRAGFTIDEAEIGDGVRWLSLLDTPAAISTANMENGQVMLARAAVPPAVYSRLRLRISAPLLPPDGHPLAAEPLTLDLSLANPMALKAGDSPCLFVVWDVAATLAGGGGQFRPVLRAGPQTIPLTTELAFVSCPRIHTIYIIRTDTNTVCGSWGVDGRPTYLAAFKDNDELLALLEDKAAIVSIEISSGRVKDVIKIPSVIRPSFMVLDDEARYAYVLDRKTNYLVKLNLATGGVDAKSRLTDKPDFLLYLAGRDQLAVSSALGRKVFFIDGGGLDVLATLASVSSPLGLYFDSERLYVAEGRANSVEVHDVNSGRVERRNVGRRPSRFASNGDYVFVANTGAASLSVLLPGQLNVVRDIRVGAGPEEMALSTTRRWLYVCETGEGGLGVVDLTSHRLASRIVLRARPFDIEVIQ